MIEERLSPPQEGIELLASFGCDVDAIVSLRQCAWIFTKLSGMKLNWELPLQIAFQIVWPQIRSKLTAVPFEERIRWAREQPKIKEQVPFFFPVEPKPRRKVLEPEIKITGNVIELASYRNKRQCFTPFRPAA